MIRACVAAVFWLALVACGRGREHRYEVSHSLRVDPEDGGYAMLAVGDSLAFTVDSSECLGDVCDSTPLAGSDFTWTASPAGLATMDSGGTLRAKRAGVALILARGHGRVVVDSARIYPAVASLSWEPRPVGLRVGDTLRTSVVARDSSGSEVARIAAHTILGGTGAAGQLVWWGGPDPTVVWLDKPGTLTLIARLAHRWDTLQVIVR